MSKIVLNDVTNLNSLSVINDNFDKIEQELQNKVLYRNNPEGEPNTLETDVDANDVSIYNVNQITASSILVNGEPVLTSGNLIEATEAAVEAAESATNSAIAAAASAAEASYSAAEAAASALSVNDANIVHKTGNETIAGVKTFLSSPVAPTPALSAPGATMATVAAIQALYPVGSIYLNATNATNPGTLLGFGTWTVFGAGRVPVGFNAADPLFDTAEETGGSKDATVVSHTHTATVTDPGHTHTQLWKAITGGDSSGGDPNSISNTTVNTSSSTTGISVGISTTGSSGINANLQPYITVYMWKRTS